MLLEVALGVPLMALAVLAVLAVREILYRRSCGDIDKLPGPPALPFIGSAHNFPSDMSQAERVRMEWLEKYGRQYGALRHWIGSTPLVSVVDPEIVRELVATNKHTTKHFVYDISLQPWLGTGLLTSRGDKWHTRRRLLTPTFHFDVLKSFVDVMNEQCDVMLQQLEQHANTENEVDMFHFITRCALDIICETAMGVQLNSQSMKHGEEQEYVTAVYSMSAFVMERIRKPWLANDFILNLLPIGKVFRNNLRILHSFTERVIKQRRQSLDLEEVLNTRRKAFLDLLLVTKNEDGSLLSDADLREEVDTFMFAGHDTTSAAAAWAVFLVATNPDVQAKVHEELDEVVGTAPFLTHEHVDKLKYLELVTKEALRLKPSVPRIGRRLTEDLYIKGLRIPAGTDINIAIIELHRDPRTWGPDAHVFNPERFRNESARSPYAYIPFSAGPRNCIGQRFAQMEEKIMLAKLFSRFRFETSRTDLPGHPELILRPANGVPLRIYKR